MIEIHVSTAMTNAITCFFIVCIAMCYFGVSVYYSGIILKPLLVMMSVIFLVSIFMVK